ncbi:MAG: site-specific integrase [Acidimicrobiales bacterium]
MSRGHRRQLGGVDRLPSGRWRVRLADPGTGQRVSIGSYRTKAEAEVAFAAAITDQAKGAWVAPDKGRVTLNEYAPKWLATRLTSRGEPLRPKTLELYDSFLRLHILPTLGPMPLGRLTTATIRSWHSGLLNQGPGAASVAKCYRLLRTILATAIEDGVIVANPCSIKGAGVEATQERTLPTLAEVYALADTIRPQLRAFVLLAAFGGLRRGELLALTRRDVDLLHRTVDIRLQRQEAKGGGHLVSPPKTDAGCRLLVLPSGLVPELEAHLSQWAAPGPDGLLFPGVRGGPLRLCVWQREWTRTRVALGLKSVHLHDLRHVAGTMAAATGAGTKELMHRLGHASPRAALRYQHATAKRDEVIADGIDRILEAAREDPDSTVLPFRGAGAPKPA